MENLEVFSFGGQFRLTVQRDAVGRKRLKLSSNLRDLGQPLRPTLELLHYMLHNPKRQLLHDELLNQIWPDSGPNTLEKHVSFLRVILGDDPKKPSYIRTIYDVGYEFLMDAKREGGGVAAYPKWDLARFHELLREIKRGPENDHEDLRVVATAIGASLDELDIEQLLKRKIRIKILLINPQNEELIRARYALRQDKPLKRCLRELEDQVDDLKKYAEEHPTSTATGSDGEPSDPEEHKGSIEFGLSNVMPCGFVLHTREWALLGIYPAHDSFLKGPMLEMIAGTEPWTVLYKDWEIRWTDFKRSQRTAKTEGA